MALEQEALERCVLRADGGFTGRSIDQGVLPSHHGKTPQSYSSEVFLLRKKKILFLHGFYAILC